MINCPHCGHGLSEVIDTRSNKTDNTIRRRRKCEACGNQFTTKEVLSTVYRALRQIAESAVKLVPLRSYIEQVGELSKRIMGGRK